jgi:hypothetical protein
MRETKLMWDQGPVKGGWCAMVSRSNGNIIELRVVPFRDALALCSGMETGNLRNGH